MSEEVRIQLKTAAEDLLRRLGISGTVQVQEGSDGVTIQIETPDSALLIGYRGSHLYAFEYILRLILRSTHPDLVMPELHVDVGGYKERQVAELVSIAQIAAEKARSTSEAQILRPMNAFERRIVHTALAEMADLSTESVGMDPSRRIIIKLK